uniref:Endo-chitosanase n=1 Tax=Talaromyces marneffei PM1 TaxID=1077442 RepID=A0A093V1R0_TALMA
MKTSIYTGLAVAALAAPALAYSIPENVQVSTTNDLLKGGFYAVEGGSKNFGYCQKYFTNKGLYLKGPSTQLADMDIDCDGNQHGVDSRCHLSGDTQPNTAFKDQLPKYGISDLRADIHPYVVLGNYGSYSPTFHPEDHNIKPLSVVAVVCNNKLIYGIWGDTNGDDGPPLIGESSLAVGTACFGQSMNGNNGHDATDVLYIAFAGDHAVPGSSANWKASSYAEFAASIKELGDTLVASLRNGARPPNPLMTNPEGGGVSAGKGRVRNTNNLIQSFCHTTNAYAIRTRAVNAIIAETSMSPKDTTVLPDRRVNYAKRLHDEFSSVSARMDKLEATMAKLPEQIAQSLSSSSPTSNASSLTRPAGPRSLLKKAQAMILNPRNAENKYEEASEKWQPHFERIQIAQGGERIVGYPAALTLFVSVKRHLLRALTSTTRDPSQDTNSNHYLSRLMRTKPFLQPEFQKHSQVFPFNGICNDPSIKSDGRALSTPPRTLLVPALEYFFEHVNSYIPIFEEAYLREMVDEHYADINKDQSAARPLILNCIILLSLNNSARRNGITDAHMGTMGEDLIPTFRRNCDRALANLFEFTRPAQGNALVARESYGSMAFEKVCQVASQLVRSTGLNLARRPPPASWEKMNQPEKLFWAMYMLDKQRVFFNGHPCDLYLFDSDLQLASCRDDATYSERLNAATVHLTAIWEEIFIALYSCRGSRSSNAHRSRQAEMLRNLVNEWGLQHHTVINQLSSLEVPPGSDPLQIELKYTYHATQILINRCDSSEESQQQILFHARSALKIIHLLASAQPLTVSHLVALERIFRNYPAVAFTDLLAVCLTNGVVGREEDLQLLRTARSAYQLIHEPNMYFGNVEKPYIGFNWCIGLLDLVESAERGSNRTHTSVSSYQPITHIQKLDNSKNSFQMNVASQGNVVPNHQVPPANSVLTGLPNDVSVVPTTGSLEMPFFDFDFYQGLFQQESWDLSTSL